MILRLAIASLFARALTVGMTVLAIALSVSLFLGVEKIRTGAKSSFADTISVSYTHLTLPTNREV